MTPWLLVLALAQAGLLLGSAILLSNVVLRAARVQYGLGSAVALAPALVIARFGAASDLHRILPGVADCMVLVLSVACVRFIAVAKEERRLATEHALAVQLAAEAADAARRAAEAERIQAAAAALAAFTAETDAATTPVAAARRLTPSMLSGGASATRPGPVAPP